jgi:DivIVA domain-containing protein
MGRMSDELVKEIQGVRFTPTRIREGYAMDPVDDLLDGLVRAVHEGTSLGPLCAAAQFPTVSWQEAYNMDEVDAFLSHLGGATVSARPDGWAPRSASDAPGFFGRILGRAGLR